MISLSESCSETVRPQFMRQLRRIAGLRSRFDMGPRANLEWNAEVRFYYTRYPQGIAAKEDINFDQQLRS